MSGFDDEFGLFGEESDEPERRSALPARRIASDHTDEPPRERPPRRVERQPRARTQSKPSAQSDPWAPARRASELLGFLAQRLVSKPDAVKVELFTDENGEAVIELVVDPEDLGKVIGRKGRVAQDLRTLVRAAAESRVGVDIIDTAEAEEPLDGNG